MGLKRDKNISMKASVKAFLNVYSQLVSRSETYISFENIIPEETVRKYFLCQTSSCIFTGNLPLEFPRNLNSLYINCNDAK